MIKNVLVRGNQFAGYYSRSHCLGNNGFTLWKVKLNYSNMTGELITWKVIDTILYSIADKENDISKRIKWIYEEEFDKIVAENFIKQIY